MLASPFLGEVGSWQASNVSCAKADTASGV
jgi:hypothetical protein